MKMEFLERAKLENFVQRSARGDKLSLYSHAQLAQANAMIGPWLVAQAKRRSDPGFDRVHRELSDFVP